MNSSKPPSSFDNESRSHHSQLVDDERSSLLSFFNTHARLVAQYHDCGFLLTHIIATWVRRCMQCEVLSVRPV